MTATIAVHEFISADGVFEPPSWTFEFGFDPQKMVARTLLFEGGPVRWTRRKAASVRSSSITAACGQGPRTASAATGPP